jgi:hypothetical protein
MQKLMLTAIAALALICVGCPQKPAADTTKKDTAKAACKEGCKTEGCKGCAEVKKACKEGCKTEGCKGCAVEADAKKKGCCGTCGGGDKKEDSKTE